MVIDGVPVGGDHCYVIAEIGHNHQGSVDICKKMIEAAKWAGCDAVKLQKRDNKTLYAPEFYNAPYNSENAFGATYGEHREALEFGWEQYQELQGFALKTGISFFATAFDVPSLAFLDRLGVPALKIASGDLKSYEFLSAVNDVWAGRPVIFSTGGGTLLDVYRAQSQLDRCQLAVLHCTSGYPAKYEELNLNVIKSFVNHTSMVVGWSGHDTGIHAAVAAYALGARIIEKHFTLNRAWKGTDQAMSLEPQGMKTMVDNLRDVARAMGDGIKAAYPSEIAALTKQRKNAEGQIDGRTVS